MNIRTKQLCESQALIFKALAHPTRLYLIELLSSGEKCVCELNEPIDADMSTVSKHLSVLKQAGIVADEKRGLQVWYSLKMPCVLKFFTCIESVLQNKKNNHPFLK